jgi:hypothetical protein
MSAWTRLGALLCVTACAQGQAVRVPAKPITSHTSANEFMTPPPVPQYRLSWIYPEQAPPEAGLLAGVRLLQRADGLTVADSAAKIPLTSGRAVPSAAGGGFVFWSSQGLYRASTFLGRLEPLAATPFAVDDVSFGPHFWLARSAEGERLALDPKTGADVAFAPQGLIDIAAAGDGRVVAVLELGRAVVSTDGGATYREVQSELGAPVTRLSSDPLGFVLEPTQLVGLDRDGKLVRRVPSQKRDAGGTFRDRRVASILAAPARERERWAPLNQAILNGVSGAPGRALVALEASVNEVDLSTGKLVHQGPELLPGSPSCSLLRASGELLMACQAADTLVILSKVDTDHPVVERTFHGKPELRVAPDRLLVEMGCDPEPAPFSVCSRFASGEWKQLTKRPEAPADLAAAAASPPVPTFPALAYVPRADGGAVALVRELSGYIDLASGRAIRLKEPVGAVLNDPSHCFIDGNGTLRCLTLNGAFAWDASGNAEPPVFKFSWLLATGARGLGKDDKGRLFQTEDFGKTWGEVPPPPVLVGNIHQKRGCSEVGCAFEGWLRTGWDRGPIKTSEPPALVELAERPGPRLPTLTCRVDRAVPPTLFQSPNARSGNENDDAPAWVAGFGVDRLPANHHQIWLETHAFGQDGNTTAMHGILSTFSKEVHDPRAPDAQLIQSEPLRFRGVDYFDTAARINTASVSVLQLSRAARRAGTAIPDTDFEGGGPRAVIPVLAREPGRAAGFIALLDRGKLWINGSQVTLLTPWDDTWSVSSAVLERDGSLLVLMTSDADGPRVWRHRQGAGVEVFGVPATPLRPNHDTPDALGRTDQGETAVLRFPSSPAPPSAADPPLAYVPGKPLQSLAPWSSLKLESDPACADKSGYRAIVLPARSWFRLRQGATEVPQDLGMVAAVRWSKERVCLEALEVAGDYLSHDEQQSETRVVWNLAQKGLASHVGVGSGYELREPMSCSVSASAAP